MKQESLARNARSLPYDQRIFVKREGCLSVVNQRYTDVNSQDDGPRRKAFGAVLMDADVCFFGNPIGKLLRNCS